MGRYYPWATPQVVRTLTHEQILMYYRGLTGKRRVRPGNKRGNIRLPAADAIKLSQAIKARKKNETPTK